MDYKKLIIINLAFLIILGKTLLFLFAKMQRNLKIIKVNENETLNKMVNFYKDNNLSQYKINNELSLEQPMDIGHLQEFSINYKNILAKYNGQIFEYSPTSLCESSTQFDCLVPTNSIHDKNNIEEIVVIVEKTIRINEICQKLKTRKLKVFGFICFLIILFNFIATRSCLSWTNYQKIKQRVKGILIKIEKTKSGVINTPIDNSSFSLSNNQDSIFKEDYPPEEDISMLETKKNN